MQTPRSIRRFKRSYVTALTEFYCNRATARQIKGDLEGAIVDYTTVIKLKPGYVSAYRNRGLARMLLGRSSQAELDFEECLNLDPGLKPKLEEHLETIRVHIQLRH